MALFPFPFTQLALFSQGQSTSVFGNTRLLVRVGGLLLLLSAFDV